MKHALMIVLLALVACTKPEAEVAHPDAAPPAVDDGAPAPNEAACEFCRPEAAVQTFIGACAAKDMALLARCFAADAAKEFSVIVEGTISEEDLGELQEMFAGAEVAEVTVGADEASATVRVNLTLESRPHEDLKLVKEGEEWKILDF